MHPLIFICSYLDISNLPYLVASEECDGKKPGNVFKYLNQDLKPKDSSHFQFVQGPPGG